MTSSSTSPEADWPRVYFREGDDPEMGKQLFLLDDNRVVVADVLREFGAFKVDVKHPTTGEFVQLVPNASGRSVTQFENNRVYDVRAVKEEPFEVATDDGGTIVVQTRQGYINVASIQAVLAGENKTLRSINGVAPSFDSNGWSTTRYNLAEGLQLQVRPKPVDAAGQAAVSSARSAKIAWRTTWCVGGCTVFLAGVAIVSNLIQHFIGRGKNYCLV
ncbi:hypothetical protein COCOBI_13-4670 [Coccomyxa sp. Obi]|nr:hypothetical protein COCOBI_13-4670 [Coccomyxa sp. Obi]